MNILINYADRLYFESQKENSKSGLENGFDKVIEYGRKDIDEGYLNKHKEILDIAQGAGLWLWKPYIIYKTLLSMGENDILFYCDSGATFIGDMSEYFELCRQDEKGLILFGGTYFINSDYTSPACFEIMQGEKYKDCFHLQASFQLCRRTAFTLKFYRETLDYCENKKAIETGDFPDHRHDQSILSIMSQKHNVTTLSDPSQLGERDMVIVHHRKSK